MSGCLGTVLAALVDGELDHAARERAHRHLAHCDVCRAEVEAQRRLKASLSRLAPASPSGDLLARLHGLSRPHSDDSPTAPALWVEPARPAPPRSSAPAPRGLSPLGSPTTAAGAPPTRPSTGRPASRPASSRSRPAVLSRRSAAGSAFAVLGVAAALALGAPPQRTAPPPVDAPTGVLATEVASVTRAPSGGRLGGGLTTVSTVPPAGFVDASRPEVPVRAALLTDGGRARR